MYSATVPPPPDPAAAPPASCALPPPSPPPSLPPPSSSPPPSSFSIAGRSSTMSFIDVVPAPAPQCQHFISLSADGTHASCIPHSVQQGGRYDHHTRYNILSYRRHVCRVNGSSKTSQKAPLANGCSCFRCWWLWWLL
ncbi:hypothetical protein DQ04_04281050 [Trypanosoma grayi]|uniref:hypothetical protein n=1 Tax=Trypanosoma grayi TaxID=71804 RepID=UPI0004F45FDE|nr:hypothetical protein DQ04_04281050 [Trypanosoma grayi]KEG10029.1 hypothetical protein DQ04_04281050 [Trypanosoma grayi]